MEFKRPRLSLTKAQVPSSQLAINFYLSPPLDNLSLEEFENHAVERLKALRIVEYVGMKYRKNSVQFRENLASELKLKSQISLYYREGEEELKQRFDHISHFILRLAYCKSEELRRWFLQQECDLFRARLQEHSNQLPQILKNYGLEYEPKLLSPDEELYKLVEASTSEDIIPKGGQLKPVHIYKVPFTEVLELIQSCEVYMENGYAFTTEQQFLSVIVNVFRINLSQALAATARQLPILEEDKRLLQILGSINEAYFGKDYGKGSNAKAGEVVPEMVDDLSKTSFPLCMRTLHESLRANHHLKHGGRLQYGFFIKAIGMKLEDALRFWREEFSKKMDVDQFDKKYAYNIRHSFGQEGIRKNYSAYSCMKIITSSPPASGECHGCPYKHMDKSSLLLRLRNLNLTQKGIQDILDLATGGHYQVACTRCFELTHKVDTLNQAINHPNEYFEESRKVLANEVKTEKKS